MTMIHIAVGLLFEEGSPEILESTFYEDERGPLHLSMDPARFSQLKSYEEVQHEIRLVLGVEKTALRRGGLNLHKEFRRLEESGWHAFAHLRSIALLSDIEQPHSTLHIFEWVRYDLYPHAMHRGIRLIPSWKGICKPEAWKFLYGEVFSGVQEREVTAAPFQPLRLLPKGEIPDFSGALEEFAVDFDIKIVRPQKPMPFFLTPGVEIVRYLGKESSIDIPARIAGEPVRISDFAAPPTLREVRIAEGVEVFDFAFWKCENLYDENGFQILGDRLLSYRGAAETVRVPDGVREIGSSAFSNRGEKISAPLRVVLPEGVRKMERFAFENCETLRSISLPESLEWIGYRAFHNCENLVEANLPSGTRIDDKTFEGCSKLLDADGFAVLNGSLVLFDAARYALRAAGAPDDLSLPESVESIRCRLPETPMGTLTFTDRVRHFNRYSFPMTRISRLRIVRADTKEEIFSTTAFANPGMPLNDYAPFQRLRTLLRQGDFDAIRAELGD